MRTGERMLPIGAREHQQGRIVADLGLSGLHVLRQANHPLCLKPGLDSGLVGKVLVQGRRPDADALGNASHRQPLRPFSVEQLPCSGHDLPRTVGHDGLPGFAHGSAHCSPFTSGMINTANAVSYEASSYGYWR